MGIGQWDRLLEIRGIVLKSIQGSIDAKEIGARSQAEITILCGGRDSVLLSNRFCELHELFGVAGIELILEPYLPELVVVVKRTGNRMCDRCRKYRENAEEHLFWPGVFLCSGCVQVMCVTGDIDLPNRYLLERVS